MRILGINAIFHDPAAAVVIDGRVVAAAEEERFSRRKHGKRPVPFSAWELPGASAAWCLAEAGLRPGDLDAVSYSFDAALCRPAPELGLDDPWEHLRITYAERAREFIADALPGVDPDTVQYVGHHAARICPVPGHPCLDRIDPDEVVQAVAALAGRDRGARTPVGVAG